MTENLKTQIDNCDLCIVGVGHEWDWVTMGIHSDERYSKLLKYCDKEGFQWLLPLVEYEYAFYHTDNRIDSAYEGLRKLLGKKRYFLVSDLFLQDALMHGFEPENCVYPCGNYMYLQTPDLEDELILSEKCPEFQAIIDRIHDIIVSNDGNFDEGESFVRPFLNGKELYLNQKRQEYRNIKYNEIAYKGKWDDYMRYLSSTLNFKLLVLELGVGLEYPTVVRWPFEKVAFINNKAHFIRVHERLYQHTKEIEDKTDSIQMNSVNFILQECKGL